MMIDEDTHAHLTPEAILNCWSGINENIIRTPETHPLTGVCAMTNSQCGWTNTAAKTVTKGRVRR